MKLLKAKYIGQNGSMGYKTDQEYTLLFKENNRSFFSPKYPIEIWRSKSRGVSNGYCPYSSINSFLDNWEIVKIA